MLKALHFFLFATLRLLVVPTAFTMHSGHSLIFPNSFSRVYLAAGRTLCCWQQQQQRRHLWAALIWPHKDICSDRWWLSAHSRDCFCSCHESQASLFSEGLLPPAAGKTSPPTFSLLQAPVPPPSWRVLQPELPLQLKHSPSLLFLTDLMGSSFLPNIPVSWLLFDITCQTLSNSL